MIDRERLPTRVVVRNQPAGLEREAGLAMKMESFLDDMRGRSECAIRIPGLDVVLVGDIVAQRLMQRPGSKRALAVQDGRERLPGNLDVLRGVLCGGAALGHNRHHRLALIMSNLDRH